MQFIVRAAQTVITGKKVGWYVIAHQLAEKLRDSERLYLDGQKNMIDETAGEEKEEAGHCSII